eukprot:6687317-Pyramimonas_sp.AAC.1
MQPARIANSLAKGTGEWKREGGRGGEGPTTQFRHRGRTNSIPLHNLSLIHISEPTRPEPI